MPLPDRYSVASALGKNVANVISREMEIDKEPRCVDATIADREFNFCHYEEELDVFPLCGTTIYGHLTNIKLFNGFCLFNVRRNLFIFIASARLFICPVGSPNIVERIFFLPPLLPSFPRLAGLNGSSSPHRFFYSRRAH